MANVNSRKAVLVTGAAGRIGRAFSEAHSSDYSLRLMVQGGEDDIDSLRALGEVVACDLADLERLKTLCEGVHTIVHMAGDPDPSATWADLLATNIIGTYHVFAAAKFAGVKRVIYASSIHAVSGYPADYQVHTTDPVNPGDLYGVSKCFGEALAKYAAGQEGLSAICLRIGGFQPPEKMQAEAGLKMLDAWVSHRDLVQLIRRCIDAEAIQFAIFHGLSDNRFKRLDITDAREIVGYAPQDDITELHPSLAPLRLNETVAKHDLSDGEQSGLRDDVK